MLITLVIWFYIAFITTAYGLAAVRLLENFSGIRPDAPIHFPILIIVGLGTAAWIASVFSLLFKVGLTVHLIVLAGALLSAYFFFTDLKDSLARLFHWRHWSIWLLLLLGMSAAILYAVKPPSNPDTQLYHAQAIRWIEEYPTVPGLGNLDPRQGSSSNWLIVNALFSFAFLGVQSFHLVPSFFFLICLVYFLSGMEPILDGRPRLSDIVKVSFIPCMLFVLIDEISSPGTDLPVILFFWVILSIWLEALEGRENPVFFELLVFLLSVFVVTFKVSGVMIVAIALWIWMLRWRKERRQLLWISVSMAVVILLPWCVRTFLLSGYWLYPLPLTKYISPNVDWKVSAERVASFKNGIQAWGILPGAKWDEIASLSVKERFHLWYTGLTTNRKLIFISAITSPIIYWFTSLFSGRSQKYSHSYAAVILISYLNLIFWLLTAPNFRFGYGFLFGISIIAFSPLAIFILNQFRNHQAYFASAVILILSIQLVHVILMSARDGTQYGKLLILPADYSHAASVPCDLENATIYCARNWRQCGYDAFPCVSQVPKNVEMRGETLQNGFRMTSAED